MIIHHSASHTTANDFAAVVLSYWDYHVNTRGWADIGYNWLVDRNGVLYKGRAWKSETEENVQGAHAAGANRNTAGLCYIGNYEVNIPAQTGLDMLENMLAFLSNKYEINPLKKSYLNSVGSVKDNITGHGLSGSTTTTACPGKNIISILGEIRKATFNKLVDTTATPQITVIAPTSEIDSVYLSKDIVIKFSHEMDTASVESSFTIVPAHQGAINWSSGNRILTYSPVTNLTGRTNYTITIGKAAKSKWNISLTEDFNFSFTTKANNFLSILLSYPKDGDVDVPLDTAIEILFDSPLELYSVGRNFSLKDADSNDAEITANKSNLKIGLVKFTAALKENTTYELIFMDSLKSIDNFPLGKNKKITFTTEVKTSVSDESVSATKYELFEAYPNPFNPTATISYTIPNANVIANGMKQSDESSSINSSFSNHTNRVKLKVYNALGKEVVTLVNEVQNPGKYSVNFDASNLSSGIYFYRLQAGSFISTKKMVLMK